MRNEKDFVQNLLNSVYQLTGTNSICAWIYCFIRILVEEVVFQMQMVQDEMVARDVKVCVSKVEVWFIIGLTSTETAELKRSTVRSKLIVKQ